MNTEPDNLFDSAAAPVRPFRFDAEVARVFPDMVRRSVPGYAEMVEFTGLLARRLVPADGVCYDLGCSLGAVTEAIVRQTPASVRVIAVDNAPAMIAKLCASSHDDRITPICADAETIPIHNAALVVLNLTLQFIAPERRLALLERIHAGLIPNGALILVEKIALPNDRGGQLLTELHTDFKRAQGYSELAISGKRAALEQVLIPDSIAVHEVRLSAAGFTGFTRWYQSLNFIAWMAWK
ncbi:carboxy-S-adenosyl-L-methionine synthase CmoA [Chromatium okenii]|uniref:Carboxy-S-adenosyl-L-methionine synthase n=1 Tax=Chromatium okenii TaxID=61644 RepID=A0A2S7XTN9_9GAMM|nr:carboxy-S-adenosyl-L-methionine synthase CmoA [Chromatium okenii]PQJ97016.1 carboxy-S-adenosyl-L-methionine synthase CmoA [Chromatium okenii]